MPEVTAGEGGVGFRDEIWRPQGELFFMLVGSNCLSIPQHRMQGHLGGSVAT